MFIEAKSAEIKSWFDNDVFDLVNIRKFKPKNFVTGRWVLTAKRDREMGSSRSARLDGCFADFETARKMLSRRTAQRRLDRVCDFFAKMQLPTHGLSDTLTSRLRSFRGKLCTRSRCGLSATSRSREAVVPGSAAEKNQPME